MNKIMLLFLTATVISNYTMQQEKALVKRFKTSTDDTKIEIAQFKSDKQFYVSFFLNNRWLNPEAIDKKNISRQNNILILKTSYGHVNYYLLEKKVAFLNKTFNLEDQYTTTQGLHRIPGSETVIETVVLEKK